MADEQADRAPTADELRALAEQVAGRCLALGVTVVTAESCTGGLVGHCLTEIPGSSTWFLGGVIAYDNAVKAGVLGVPAATLAAHGAVSAQTAVAMAEGARRLLGASIAVSVTGIAGPGGGTEAKPVGLTYLAVADAAGDAVQRHVWPYDRSGDKRASAAAAMALVLARLEAA
ncbi:MAG: nicotinamide-nucleotide amidohydrolase family protein [Chloroflexota bacterium]